MVASTFCHVLVNRLTTGSESPAVIAMHELKLPKRQHASAVSMKNSIRETRSPTFEFSKISDATFLCVLQSENYNLHRILQRFFGSKTFVKQKVAYNTENRVRTQFLIDLFDWKTVRTG